MRAWLVPAALLLILAAGPAGAGMLVEGVLRGVPIRLETGTDPGLVRALVDRDELLVDLDAGMVLPLGRPDARAVAIAPIEPGQRFVLTVWGGRRPTVAGEKGTYLVLTRGGQTCGEVLAATWTRPLIAPLVGAVELLERSLPALRPIDRPACGPVPFRAYAAKGWPLLAGWLDASQFETTRISFDHQADPGRFARPSGG